MQARRKLIVVSNRGPIGYAREAGERVARRGAGGLVTALAPLVSHHDVTWIASALSDEDRAVAAEGPVDATAPDGSRYRLRLVAHDLAAFDLYYHVVANPVLWFLQHGLWELKHDPERDLRPAWEQGYAAVNAAFADAVVEELERFPGTAVFFHDYHLYLAPRLVRERVPDAVVGHFTHIPWVGPEGWSVLPAEIVPRHPREPALLRRRQLPHESLAERVSCHLQRAGSRRRRHARDGTSDLDRPRRVHSACGE